MHMLAFSKTNRFTGGMMADWKTAKEKAEEVRKLYKLNEPPINAFEIANNIGIKIRYFKPDRKTGDISALFDKEENKIYLNADEPSERQNFSLAHELAHHFLNHSTNEFGVYKRNSLYAVKPEKEQEADYFAAELLMPENLIKKVQKQYGIQSSNYTALSKLFGVSPTAMKYRLQSLKHGSAR